MWKKFKGLSLGKQILAVIATLFTVSVIGSAASSPQQNNTTSDTQPYQTQDQQEVKSDNTEVKKEIKFEDIPYTTIKQNDSSLAKGKTSVAVVGVNGTKQVTYEVTYTNGAETKRVKKSEEVTKQPVNEIIKVGTYVARSTNSYSSCPNGYYRNVDGNCIHSPSTSPDGATARCVDGTYSYSQNHRGTCSHHGGVAQWL